MMIGLVFLLALCSLPRPTPSPLYNSTLIALAIVHLPWRSLSLEFRVEAQERSISWSDNPHFSTSAQD